VMIPQTAAAIAAALRASSNRGRLAEVERVKSGFYISSALVYQGPTA